MSIGWLGFGYWNLIYSDRYPIPLLTSPLKGEEGGTSPLKGRKKAIFLPFRGRVRVGVGLDGLCV